MCSNEDFSRSPIERRRGQEAKKLEVLPMVKCPWAEIDFGVTNMVETWVTIMKGFGEFMGFLILVLSACFTRADRAELSLRSYPTKEFAGMFCARSSVHAS